MKRIFNYNIAIRPVPLQVEELTTFITADEKSDRPLAGEVVMIGDLVTKVEVGQKIVINPSALIGPYEVEDETIWLIPESQILYEFE